MFTLPSLIPPAFVSYSLSPSSPPLPPSLPPSPPPYMSCTCHVFFFFRIGRRACTVLSMMFAGVFCLLFSLASREFFKAGNWPSLFFWNYYKDSKWKQESAGKFIFSSVSTSRKMLAAPLILTPIDINMYAFFWVFFFRASCSHVSDSVNRPCMYDGFPGFAQFIFHWIVPDSRQVIILYVSYFNTDWAVRSAEYGNEVAQKSKSH